MSAVVAGIGMGFQALAGAAQAEASQYTSNLRASTSMAEIEANESMYYKQLEWDKEKVAALKPPETGSYKYPYVQQIQEKASAISMPLLIAGVMAGFLFLRKR